MQLFVKPAAYCCYHSYHVDMAAAATSQTSVRAVTAAVTAAVQKQCDVSRANSHLAIRLYCRNQVTELICM